VKLAIGSFYHKEPSNETSLD